MTPPRPVTRSIGDFIGKAYAKSFNPESRAELPFPSSDARSSPLFWAKATNYILLYPGSFNPPHKGHSTLLNHVINNAGEDINVAAVLLLPTDDRRLAIKMYADDDALVLPQNQRVQLWRQSGVLTERMWVFDRSEKEWTIFRSQLESDFQEARMNVKFMMLTGPDYVSQSTSTDPTYWDCKDTITTDISRPVDFISASGQLRKVYPCSDWVHPKWCLGQSRRQMRAGMKGQSDEKIEEAVMRAAQKMETIWVCNRLLKPKGTIRFIATGSSGTLSEPPSSTKIRQLLKGKCTDGAKEYLYATALSPALLVKFKKAHVPSSELQKLQTELREQAAIEAQRDWRDKIAW